MSHYYTEYDIRYLISSNFGT